MAIELRPNGELRLAGLEAHDRFKMERSKIAMMLNKFNSGVVTKSVKKIVPRIHRLDRGAAIRAWRLPKTKPPQSR